MTRRFYSAPVIENEAAYARAIEARIKANKAIGGRKRWEAKFPDAAMLNDWLNEEGEFKATRHVDPRCSTDIDPYDGSVYVIDHWDGDADDRRARCSCKRIDHPLAFYARNEFLSKMRASIDEWGGLTDGQHAAVQRAFAQAKERLAGREVARAEQKATDLKSTHVGTEGERRDWVLTVERVLSFEGQFGYTHFNICRDEAGNVVVYKGTKCWTKGETMRCKATVKKHDVRDGIAQTIIARPA